MTVEHLKDELFKLKEKTKKDMDAHKEDTDQVILRLMNKIQGGAEEELSVMQDTVPSGPANVKQETIVNILVRIELLENEIRTLKNTSQIVT